MASELPPIPRDADDVDLPLPGGGSLRLTNLRKPFWPDLGVVKGDLLRYYRAVSRHLLPHVVGRPMVMKRYPDGWRGEHFFMKRTPGHAPGWLETCAIEHGSGSVIDFAVVRDAGSLLWLVNMGCIDLNPWPSQCGDTDRPDLLAFDLDPVEPAGFTEVRLAALAVRAALDELSLPCYAKTSGSRGIHVFVPIRVGPSQKQVWRVAKGLALVLAERHPDLLTAVYRVADRPPGTVLVDYNQNAWGRTLASVYSVRPRPLPTVSTPFAWEELEAGFDPEAWTLATVPARLDAIGDLWRPLTWPRRGRADLSRLL